VLPVLVLSLFSLAQTSLPVGREQGSVADGREGPITVMMWRENGLTKSWSVPGLSVLNMVLDFETWFPLDLLLGCGGMLAIRTDPDIEMMLG
jgi:hypothetical protein